MKGVILVVDDSKEHLLLVNKTLEQALPDCEVMTCDDSQKALMLIRTYHPRLKLVITDLLMPNVNGVHMIQEIVKDYPLRKFKIIVLSGVKEKSILGIVAELKVDGFILKPFQIDDLKKRVTSILKPPEEHKEEEKVEEKKPQKAMNKTAEDKKEKKQVS